jgi:hypothetical protein
MKKNTLCDKTFLVSGLSILQEPEEDLVTDPEIELSSFSANVVSINKNMDNAKTTKIPDAKNVENFDDG